MYVFQIGASGHIMGQSSIVAHHVGASTCMYICVYICMRSTVQVMREPLEVLVYGLLVYV